MIGMALVAVLISMTLVSCDDDDDDYDEPNPPSHNDPADIMNTRWQIESINENDFRYGPGAYLDFYDDGTGKFFEGDEETDFTYYEENSLTIQLHFGDGSTMIGEWNYTDSEKRSVDFEYGWSGEDVGYTMRLTYVGEFE